MVDIGLTGQSVADGFDTLSSASDSNNASGSFGGLSVGTVDLSVTATGGAGFRDRGQISDDIADDFIFGTQSVFVTFGGLSRAQTYSFKLWSHDAGYAQSTFDIYANGTLTAGTFSPSTGSSGPITTASFNFVADSGDNVIELREVTQARGTDSAVILNAIEVSEVPAPATLALFGLGLVGLGWKKRKTG
ncbi:PEP-CTERM putative exosortase interaction domain protein [gamma proteobacterium NOR5-3]|nr:PEP-CTERM putative exosortase interaction domain protein [gamma proteobacterium NOR5-3]